uniref:Formin-like protein n=2 Tax=Musa acuminata subsp. malaccensis TaxID=214687 RepID=A0A804I2C1_MUSAM|nr:PREDICTED: formin-like protein 1 [Musa acuminata subsp. malaccensis]
MSMFAFFLLLSDASLHFLYYMTTITTTTSTATTTSIAIHNRRTLHQPFFPLTSSSLPPAQPPSPSLPKYPSSSATSHSFRPFFPLYPSPPPPPPPSPVATLPTFPANISSLVSSPSRHSPPRLVPAVVSPLLALALLALSLALFVHIRRRRRRGGADKDARSDSLRFFPPDTTASDGRKLSATSSAAPAPAGTAGSEFLYLGTLVNSRGRANESSAAQPAAGGGSPYRKLGSPELRPLPPLPRQFQTTEGGRSSSEEFYSPKNSPGGKGSSAAGPASSSKKPALGSKMERCGSRSSTLSTPSCISSNVASSPTQSSPTTSSPPPLRPPPLLRPPTPSPPKRRPMSHSSPSSPPEADCDRKSATLQYSGQNLQSPRKIGDFARNSVAVGHNPVPPPPPLPPPAPDERREGQNVKMPAFQPPVLVHPRIPVAWSSSVAPENSNAAEKHEENPRPKLKPLHWDKVRASSDQAMVWDQLKSGSFQLNEEMIETLFLSNTGMTTKEMSGGQINPPMNQESRILEPKKSQNIAILLKALNVNKEDVCEALLEGKVDSLGNEILEALTKMVPSREEELKLKEYKNDSPFKLGPAESFLKAVLDIPFAFKRVDAMLYIANFYPEVNHLRNLFRTLEIACEELRSSRMFSKLLEAVLKTGNRMNVGTNRGEAHAFKLDALLKLVDVKGTDGKTTLLHFVVREISRAEGSRLSSANFSSINHQSNTVTDLEYCKLGIQVVSSLSVELSNVKKAAAMDSDMLSFYVAKLGGGLGKIQEVLQLNNSFSNENGHHFHDAMIEFMRKAEDEILDIQARESSTLSMVKEITEYFQGDSTKEESHPFRVFMVIRDFLATLDQVCREVEKINEHNITIMERHFPVTANQTSEPVFPSFQASRSGSSDDDSSLSS